MGQLEVRPGNLILIPGLFKLHRGTGVPWAAPWSYSANGNGLSESDLPQSGPQPRTSEPTVGPWQARIMIISQSHSEMILAQSL